MKTKAALLSLVLILTSLVSFSQFQEKNCDSSFKKNLIGIQYNPLYNGDRLCIGNLYSIRYSYKIINPLIIGAELSGYFPNKNFAQGGQFYNPDYSVQDHYGVSTNIFIRYTIRPDKRIQGFLEVSPYSHLYFEKPIQYQDIDFFIYIAPGLSVFSKNKRFSIDLYYKYSNQTFFNRSHGALSYKLNFHF
jgi:hypothetical protein